MFNSITDKKYLKTLKELSKTDCGNYATTVEHEAIGFDFYISDMYKNNTPSSVDAIMPLESSLLLIEFKNKDILKFEKPTLRKKYEECEMCNDCDYYKCDKLNIKYQIPNYEVEGIVKKIKDTMYTLKTHKQLEEFIKQYSKENIKFILCGITENSNSLQRSRAIENTFRGKIHKMYINKENIFVAYDKKTLEKIIKDNA